MSEAIEHKHSPIADKLARAAKALVTLKRELLDELKKEHTRLERDDFLWHVLIQSFATLGGSSGYEHLIRNEANYREVTYERLQSIKPEERQEHVEEILSRSRVRYQKRKAIQICRCFDIFESYGGQKATKMALETCDGAQAKLDFLQTFPGIGEKYSRNMMMDVYHVDFRNHIAIDSRIQSITKAWGLAIEPYDAHEQFYLDVAELAGIESWELDRLMYRFPNVFMPPLC